ncbi:S-adenosyl-L-methionine-dependent methyltransferase [Neurospora crassa]|nr:S-adenosyl-L-methionine-dependent methyltransferase [Neurospora crassa]
MFVVFPKNASLSSIMSNPPVDDAPPSSGGALLGAHYWTQQGLPADDTDDADSTLGDEIESSTASLSSSILNYRNINGRTYHSHAAMDEEYWAPNDPKHLEALDIFYHAIDMMLEGKLHQAPLSQNIENAVDIGTGSGLWAIDFADQYTNCTVTGTDISPVQPSWVPPNLLFEIDDATKEWTFRDDYFDYIHMQLLNGAFDSLTHIYSQAFRCCKPGGWFEHVDVSVMVESDDGSVKENSPLGQYGKLFEAAGNRVNRMSRTADFTTMEDAMKEAGFGNITVKKFKMPVSPWPSDKRMKDIGLYAYATMTTDVEGIIQFMFGTILGWSQEEIAVYADLLRRQLRRKDVHGYYTLKVVYGQKPQ